jgi:autotransporter-associated beta strand protein
VSKFLNLVGPNLHTTEVLPEITQTHRGIKFMKNGIILSTICLASFLTGQSAQAAARTWDNSGTDFNAGTSWVGDIAPGSNDVGLFTAAPTMQPNVTANLTIAGLRFSAGSSGYDITSSSAATVLTLNAVNTTGSGGTTTAASAAIRIDDATATETIDAPLNLAPSTFISTFFQEASDGGTLILNGVISETSTVLLSLKNGTFQLNNANTYSGGTAIDAAGTIVQVGNDSGLGTGSLTFGASATIQAGGGPRTLANNVSMSSGTPTIGGSNNITFNGNWTNSGAANRTITVNNSANTTIAGNLYLAADDTASRTVTINGTGSITISGVVANNAAANSMASNLVKGGSNTLMLTAANTYTGTTTVSAGALLVSNSSGSGTGTGAVQVNAGTLGGTGSVSGAVTIGNGIGLGDSFIAPGASVGTFTTTSTLSIANDGIYTFELNSDTSTADKIVANGVSLASTSSIAFADLGSTVLTLGTTFTIIDNTSGGAITGIFSNLADDGLVAIGLNTYQADYQGGTGNDLTLTVVVPEPTTMAMMALGAGLLVGVQRFRRKLR